MDQTGENLTLNGIIDAGRNEHWHKYYSSPESQTCEMMHPSMFAFFCNGYVGDSSKRILDIGCGNGRDANYFGRQGNDVVGIDACEEAIDIARKESGSMGAECTFLCMPVEELGSFGGKYDIAYMRWFLHTLDQQTQDGLLDNLAILLHPPAILMIEARTLCPSIDKGGHHETHDGHYRRLVHPQTLFNEVEHAGFRVMYLHISREFAPMEGKNAPQLVRIVAERKQYAMP